MGTTVASRVRQERLRAGLSQTQLAGGDLTPGFVSLVEAGRRHPSARALAVFAERLGTSVDYLEHGTESDVEVQAQQELSFARLAMTNGEARTAVAHLVRIDLDRVCHDTRVQTQLALADAHELSGDLAASTTVLVDLTADLRRIGDWELFARASMTMVGNDIDRGQLTTAIETGNSALAEYEKATGTPGTDAHLRLASTILWAYYERGDLTYALYRARELVALADRVGTALGRGSVCWNAAMIAQRRGQDELALEWYHRAAALLTEAGELRDVPRLRSQIAQALLALPEPDPHAALHNLDLAAPQLADTGSRIDNALIAITRGRAFIALAEPQVGEGFVREGLALLPEDGGTVAASAHAALGDALAMQGRPEDATVAYLHAVDLLTDAGADRDAAAILRTIGDRLAQTGAYGTAAGVYQMAAQTVVSRSPYSYA